MSAKNKLFSKNTARKALTLAIAAGGTYSVVKGAAKIYNSSKNPLVKVGACVLSAAGAVCVQMNSADDVAKGIIRN